MCVTLTAVRRPVGSCSVRTASIWILKSMEMPLRSPRPFQGEHIQMDQIVQDFKTIRYKS